MNNIGALWFGKVLSRCPIKIEDCSIIIPNRAFRDEGTSYHYLPESEYIDLDSKYTETFKKILNKFISRLKNKWYYLG